jgi:hypothetical protein
MTLDNGDGSISLLRSFKEPKGFFKKWDKNPETEEVYHNSIAGLLAGDAEFIENEEFLPQERPFKASPFPEKLTKYIYIYLYRSTRLELLRISQKSSTFQNSHIRISVLPRE